MNEKSVEKISLERFGSNVSKSKIWPAEKLLDLRFCVRPRLPLYKAASFLGRSEQEVRDKAAEMGLTLLEDNAAAATARDQVEDRP